jgi:hypothetical protein
MTLFSKQAQPNRVFFFFHTTQTLGTSARGLRVPVAIAAQQQRLHESFRR